MKMKVCFRYDIIDY